MLNDPSVEFRRDAVARLIGEAENDESSSKADAARETYHKALSAVRDLDQVQAIVKKLEGFGEKVDLTRHFGYLIKWKLIGPFDNTDEKGFDIAYPPERGVDFAAEYKGTSGSIKWTDHTTEDPYGKVDLNKLLVKANSLVAYAAAEFMADKPGNAEIRMATTNANKIWLNGELITQNNVYHAGEKMDQYIGKGKLKAGRNVILVKVLQNNQKEDWCRTGIFSCASATPRARRSCHAIGSPEPRPSRLADAKRRRAP